MDKLNQVSDHAIEYGMNNLTDAENLALATGIPLLVINEILKEVDHGIHGLKRMSMDDLKMIANINHKVALRLKSVFMFAFRVNIANNQIIEKISSSRDIYIKMRPYFMGHSIEQFYVMALNRTNEIIKIKQISVGGMAGTVVDAKVVFKFLVSVSAHSFVCAHNHPSNNFKPSEQDITLTKRLVKIGRDLDLVCLDHVIICDNAHYSFLDEGKL